MARGEKGRGGLEHLKFRELGEISEGSGEEQSGTPSNEHSRAASCTLAYVMVP